jgi:hypothetical protein
MSRMMSDLSDRTFSNVTVGDNEREGATTKKWDIYPQKK